MHDHDPDQIAALAEGSLAGEAAFAAEESLAGCEECLAELTAQRLALAAIAGAARPGLSMAESADLRRAVANAIGLAPVPQPKASRRPWLGLATAAAVVVVLIAIAPVVNLLSTGSDAGNAAETTIAEVTREGAVEEVAGSQAPETTVAAPAEAPAAEAPTAGGDLTAAADDGGALPDSFLDFGSVGQLEDFLAAVPEGVGEPLTNRSLSESELQYYEDRFSAEFREGGFPGCPASTALEAVADAESVITIGIANLGGVEFVVAVVTTADGSQAAVAIDAVACEVVAQVDL